MAGGRGQGGCLAWSADVRAPDRRCDLHDRQARHRPGPRLLGRRRPLGQGHPRAPPARDAGESPGQISQELPPAAFENIAPDSDGYLWIKQDKFHESFAQDLSPEEALVMAVTQKAPLGSTFGDTVTAPAWRSKPCWYQVSAADRMIHPDDERRMAERMKPRKAIELDAGHASPASQPVPVTDLIEEAALALSAP
ncbi:alpha/beta hydrolase [Streptomyces virginiae]